MARVLRHTALRKLLSDQSARAALSRSIASDAGASKVLYPASQQEYLDAIQKAGSSTVSYFTAAWCGPCRAISPMIDEMSVKFDKVSFLKLDIDNENLLEIARENEVVSVPTFVFRQGKNIVDKCVGADPRRIAEGLEKVV